MFWMKSVTRCLRGASARDELGGPLREWLDLRLGQMEERIMSALSDLQAAVAAEDTVIASAITLLGGLKAQLDAAGTDPVALAALSADIAAQTASLAAAVSENTPAAEPPTP